MGPISLRMHRSDAELVSAAARGRSMSVSEFIRNAAVEAAMRLGAPTRPERILRPRDAADELGVSLRTVYRLITLWEDGDATRAIAPHTRGIGPVSRPTSRIVLIPSSSLANAL